MNKPTIPFSQKQTDIAVGKRVLDLESEAIAALAKSLGETFAEAVMLLASVKGRVIVSGMGKSGHVGRKIAATFASTGTPAQYVHPAEASHGDMGMVTEEDAILAISNSGETRELSDLIHYARRYSIPLIAMTSGAKSSLANHSDIVLLLPDQPEAGAIGLAPTTSTTMTLALGDALAVALWERKGFSASDFHILHPGGKLGQRLMKMKDLMHGEGELPLVRDDLGMREALLVMAEKRFGCVGVVNAQGCLTGIVTDGDLRRHMSRTLLDQTVCEVMTANPVVTTPEMLAVEVLVQMNQSKISAIFVVKDKKPVGIAHLHDFVRAGVA